MNLIRRIHGLSQAHIVTVFSVLLFVSFLMAGLVFNIAVNRYITADAVDALRSIYKVYEIVPPQTGIITDVIGGSYRRRQRNPRAFYVDSNFIPSEASANALAISEKLYRNPLIFTEGKRIRANGRVFVVSIVPQAQGAWVFYLDISGSLSFVGVVNRLLIVSVAIIWLASMIVAGVLVDSMMRPLRQLRDFVKQIGRGDFTPNSHSFVNEEFDELNQSLNNAARQLAAYDNEQKTFFQNVSHELRTPLMSIKSYAEGIKQGIMDAKTASETILDATARLTGMVEDILYVSRLDSVAPPKMEPANLCKLVEEQVRRHQALAETRGLQVSFKSDGEPIMVNCVTGYIERAVDNLIANAIRYAKAEILVECYAIGTNATIRVTDDGPGFEPGALEHVFERFYRGKKGLTGIGLSTVKSITDQHKGYATAENGNDKGAILTISLPRKR